MNVGPVEVHVSRGRRNRGISNGGGFATGAMMGGGVGTKDCAGSGKGLDDVCCVGCGGRKVGCRLTNTFASSGFNSPRLEFVVYMLHRIGPLPLFPKPLQSGRKVASPCLLSYRLASGGQRKADTRFATDARLNIRTRAHLSYKWFRIHQR